MEGNVLFNNALNKFYLQLYGIRHMVKDHSVKEETRRHHYMGYSFLLAARNLLYAPSYGQDNTYHNICYTSWWALAGTRNSSMSSPWGIDLLTHHTISRCSTTHICNVFTVLIWWHGFSHKHASFVTCTKTDDISKTDLMMSKWY